MPNGPELSRNAVHLTHSPQTWFGYRIADSRCVTFKQMSNTLTVRLPVDLAEWLDQAAQTAGVSRSGIVRMELERARKSSKRPFLRLAGAVVGPAGLSTRKGFSRK